MEPGSRSRQVFTAVATALWLCTAAQPIYAQESEATYFSGKVVRIIVGVSAGGGFDLYARMIAPYLSRALGTTVVVANQPGAGGISALNSLVVAPPDGLQMALVNGPGAALGQLIGVPGVRYDLGKVGHLGTVTAFTWVWLVAPNSPYKSAKDAVSAHKKMMWPGSGPTDGLSSGAAIACAALALDCNVVMGYPGSNDAALALAKGEMDGMYATDTSANEYLKAGMGRLLVIMNRTRSSFYPDTPTIFEELNLTADQQWLLDYHSAVGDLGRILVVPPNLPPARLAFLRAAVKEALTAPELVAEADRTQRFVTYRDAETTRAAVLNVVESVSPEQHQRLTKILMNNR